MMKHIQDFHLFESEKDEMYHMFESDIRDDTDLQADFDMLNTKLFDDYVKNIPLRWMNTKYKLGVMNYGKDGEILGLGISYMYKVTRQQYLDTMAHEMIHVYLKQKGVVEKDPHGAQFQAKAKEINDKYTEFNIVTKQNAINYKVANQGGPKTYGIVLIDEDGEQGVIAVKPQVVDDKEALDKFIEGMKGQVHGIFLRPKKVTIQIYKSSHPDIPSFKIKKSLSLNNLHIYVIDQNMANEIRKDELVREDKIK